MKEWQFDVLFFFALGGAVFLMITPVFHITVSPTSLIGYSSILTFVLTQRKNLTKSDKDTKDKERE